MGPENALMRRQGGMFVSCEGCGTLQQCAMQGNCYRNAWQQYSQGSYQPEHNQIAAAPSFQQMAEATPRFDREIERVGGYPCAADQEGMTVSDCYFGNDTHGIFIPGYRLWQPEEGSADSDGGECD